MTVLEEVEMWQDDTEERMRLWEEQQRTETNTVEVSPLPSPPIIRVQ